MRLDILLVDCDPNTCWKIEQALGSGFTVHSVESLFDAKQFLANSVPDLLVCEVILSNESGLELCRFVRNMPLHSNLPILILTSLTTLQDKVAGFEAGADDYVVKPFDAHHLMARIRLLLRIKWLEQRAPR